MTYIIENRYSSVKGGTKVWAMLPSSPTVTVVSHRQKEKNLESMIPMPFLVDGKLYFEDVDMNKEQFYHFLENDADLSTSQPSPGDVMDLWDKLLKEYDEIVHIPMSSGLSASCSTAMGLAWDYDGKVQVVDNQRISVTMQPTFHAAVCNGCETSCCCRKVGCTD